MKRAANSIETDLARARTDRESLEQQQAQGSDSDLSTAIDAARQKEQQLEAELQESKEAEAQPSVFESYFGDEEKDVEPAPDDSVFQAYLGNDSEPETGQPEKEGLFAELAKEGGLMDRLTEHAVDAITDRDQEPEM